MKYNAKTIIYDENNNIVLEVNQYVVSIKTETNYITSQDSSTTTHIELRQEPMSCGIDLHPKDTKIIFN